MTTRDQEQRHLDRALIQGIAWTSLGRWLAQILTWVSTLFVARLLTPADYGVVSLAGVFTGFVILAAELGLGAAVVQTSELDRRTAEALAGLSAVTGAALTVAGILLSRPVASVLGDSEASVPIAVLSATFLLQGLQGVPRALLTRELRFRELAGIDAAESIVGMVVTFALALKGFGYWALIAGIVGGRVTATTSVLMRAKLALRWPTDLTDIGSSVRFGGHMLLANFFWYVFRNADVTVISRTLGRDAVGAYSVGWNLANVPVDRIGALWTRATAAVFPKVQHDPIALRRYLLRVTEGLALIGMPAAVGLALVADLFVHAVLGQRWSGTVTPLILLSLAAISRLAAPLLNQVVVAVGDTVTNLRTTVTMAFCLPPVFWLSARFLGIGGPAAAWLLVYPVLAALTIGRRALRSCECSWTMYLGAFWPATRNTALMTASVVVGRILTVNLAGVLRLVVLILLGAATYAAATWSFDRDRIRAALSLRRGEA